MPTVIIPPTDVSPNTGTGSEVLSTSPNIITPTVSVGAVTTALTDLLINPTTKASGNLIDAQVNSVSKFSVTSAGAGTFGGNLTVGGDITNNTLTISGDAINKTAGASNTQAVAINYVGYNGGTTYFRNFDVYNGKSGLAFRVQGSDSSASLAGNLTVSGGQIALAASSSTPSVLITQTDSAQYSIVRLRNTGGTAQSYEFGVGGSGTGSLAQKFYIFDNTAFATRLAIAPTTGNLLVGTTTDIGGASGGVSAKTLRLSINSTNTNYADFGPVGSAGTTADYTKLQGWSDTAVAARNLSLNPSGANVLVGTTVNSTGLLQIGTNTTTAAGGIGFGTDISLFRFTTDGQLAVSSALDYPRFVVKATTAGKTAGILLVPNNNASTSGCTIAATGAASPSLVFTSGNDTTALTLDSSQNATFAGKVRSNGTGFGVGADSDANTPVYALASVNGTFGALIKNSNAGSSAFAGVTVEADSGAAALRQYSTAHGVWAGKTLLTSPSGGTGLVLLTNGAGDNVDIYTNGTLAATFDTSQNATFAGTIKPQLAATASAPTYVKGAIYFDTTLNKLRVGGATGWETITSV